MRYRASIEGELVKKVDVVSGYIHRGIEKMCESLTYPQTLLYTERMDYMSAHINRHCLCLCIEKAMGLEVPHRAELIRMMMDELMRLSSHFDCILLWIPRARTHLRYLRQNLWRTHVDELSHHWRR